MSDLLRRIAHLIEAYQALRQAQAPLGKVKADENLFSLFGIGADEVTHSAFLAWLFDPVGSHGRGSRFLQTFLDVARPEVTLQLPETYEVQTELSRMTSTIDIAAFKAGAFVLYLENKTTSPDTPGQHDRETEDLRRLGVTLQVPIQRQLPIYLTPDGRQAQGKYADAWYRVAYRDLGFVFDRVRESTADARTRLVLKDWLRAITTFSGVWRAEMTDLSDTSVLLASHWPTVLNLEQAREQIDQELRALLFSLEADLVQQTWWNHDWTFRRFKKQIFARNDQWRDQDGRSALSMGVYDFNADHVFGPQAPPVFYFRSRPGYEMLGDVLRDELHAEGHHVLKNHRHLVHRAVLQCPADQAAIEAYPKEVRAQMLALFTEYAGFATRHQDIIREHVRPQS